MSHISFCRFADAEQLPNAQHHFSTLVLHGGTYYEIKGNYHKEHPSHQFYKAWWNHVTRRGLGAKDAIEKRVRSVLKRSSVNVVSYKYMTTIIRPGTTHMRYVSAVVLSDSDVQYLKRHNFLRELHTVGEERNREEIIRCVLYELNPITLLPKPDLAA